MSDEFFYRLKAAQFDLIEACGGVERAGDKAGYSKSVAGRWKDRGDPTLMPITAAVKLEADCGRPFVTSVMASANGRRLSDPDEDRVQQVNLMTANAALMEKIAALATDVALAVSDGEVTPTEAHIIDRGASEAETSLVALRGTLASIKALGGEKSGLRVVGGED